MVRQDIDGLLDRAFEILDGGSDASAPPRVIEIRPRLVFV